MLFSGGGLETMISFSESTSGIVASAWTGLQEVNLSWVSHSGLEWGSGEGEGVRGEVGLRGVADRDRDSLGVMTTVSIGVISRMVNEDRGVEWGVEEVEDFRASAYDRGMGIGLGEGGGKGMLMGEEQGYGIEQLLDGETEWSGG